MAESRAREGNKYRRVWKQRSHVARPLCIVVNTKRCSCHTVDSTAGGLLRILLPRDWRRCWKHSKARTKGSFLEEKQNHFIKALETEWRLALEWAAVSL